MPSGLNEAFKSPFHRSNPASQFYNLNSYTRSSNTDSLRNELYQSDFNNQYYLGTQTSENSRRLPNYNPSQRSNNLPDYSHKYTENQSIENSSQSSADSSLKNPSYLPSSSKLPTLEVKHSQDECEDLIDRVLSSQKCRKILKTLFKNDEEESISKYKKTIEGFSTINQSTSFNFGEETIKTILIYGLGGLLILCILDLFIRLGQILSRIRSV